MNVQYNLYSISGKCQRQGKLEFYTEMKDDCGFLTCMISNKDLVVRMLLRLLYENTSKMKDTLIYSSHLENPRISCSISEVLSVSHRPLSRSVINFASLSAKGHVMDYHPDNRPGKAALSGIYAYIMLPANPSSLTLCSIWLNCSILENTIFKIS